MADKVIVHCEQDGEERDCTDVEEPRDDGTSLHLQ